MISAKIKNLFENKAVRVVMFVIIAALLLVYLNRVFTIGNSDSNTLHITPNTDSAANGRCPVSIWYNVAPKL